MWSARFIAAVIAIIGLGAVQFGEGIIVQDTQEWRDFKTKYSKTYPDTNTEAYAQYYYNYNKRLISNHNAYADRGVHSYRLDVNQFTDMRLIHFNALFPEAPPSTASHADALPPVQVAPRAFDPLEELGLQPTVEDQGTKCNAGWAYSAAKAIELMAANQMGNRMPTPLSAQNLIDCAGRSKSCTNQVPQAAFDYLVTTGQDLNAESEYPNNNTLEDMGVCVPPTAATTFVNLGRYAVIPDGDDELLKQYVSAQYPVVIEFNPTSFEFMHYSSGVFTPPNTYRGSHFMVVLGYDTDASSGKDYWLVENSFGEFWGEDGYIRIERSANKKLAKNAILPTELA